MNTQNKEPNIRFDQFKELWKVVKLDSISQKVKTKNINDAFQNVLTNSAEFGIIPQRDFFDKDIANLKSLNGYYVVQPNDFVYNPRISNKAPVGPIKANFLNSTGVMSPLYYVFRTRNIDVFFLAKYFDSSYWHKFMKLNGDTGARSDRFAIKDSVFKEMPIPFPSHSEQTAIGSLFRTLDDLLASYKDNLANYQSLKTTMLSKMFPKAGQTVPEIRLDGFEGEWEIKRADEIFKSVSEKNKALLPVLSASQIDGMVLRDEIGIDIKYDEATLNNYKVVKPGQFVIHLRSFQGGFALSKLEGITSPAYTIIDFIDKKNNIPDFWNSILTSRDFIKRLETVTYGIRDGKNISFKDFSSLKFAYPIIEEQQAIGCYFSNLDQLITSYQEKISQLETLKKKLLQDMFI
ncbi:restriction endonuclease subunit S [Streptococcus thermophilus]